MTLIIVIGAMNKKTVLNKSIFEIMPPYFDEGIHAFESGIDSTAYSVRVTMQYGIAIILLIIHKDNIIFKARLKLFDSRFAYIGLHICSQRSNVNASIVKTVAIVVASKTNVFILQNTFPKVHG